MLTRTAAVDYVKEKLAEMGFGRVSFEDIIGPCDDEGVTKFHLRVKATASDGSVECGAWEVWKEGAEIYGEW